MANMLGFVRGREANREGGSLSPRALQARQEHLTAARTRLSKPAGRSSTTTSSVSEAQSYLPSAVPAPGPIHPLAEPNHRVAPKRDMFAASTLGSETTQSEFNGHALVEQDGTIDQEIRNTQALTEEQESLHSASGDESEGAYEEDFPEPQHNLDAYLDGVLQDLQHTGRSNPYRADHVRELNMERTMRTQGLASDAADLATQTLSIPNRAFSPPNKAQKVVPVVVKGEAVVQHSNKRSASVPGQKERAVTPHMLEYDRKTLFKMEYGELQKSAFDSDIAPVSTKAGESLTASLEVTFGKPQAEQQSFFAGLPIGEWEQAGEWFKEQLDKQEARLVESRASRRRLVEEFEQRVSKRWEAVEREQAALDSRLKEMGTSGSLVLRREGAV